MEGLGLPLHPRFNNRSDGNFFAKRKRKKKSCPSFLQQSDPGAEVWQVRSMTAGWFQEYDLRLVSRCFCRARGDQGVNSHSMPASTLRLFETG